jgi:hypothetical protein
MFLAVTLKTPLRVLKIEYSIHIYIYIYVYIYIYIT